MRKIAEFVDHDLKWSQPSTFKKQFELRGPDELVATLGFRNSFGTFATAQSADGAWTFKRIGFFQTKACIRKEGSEINLAVFKNKTWASGGTLEFANGPAFRASTNLWQTRFEFETESKQTVMTFKYGGVFRRSADVEVSPFGRGVNELPLLILFGWYIVIMLDSDMAVAASAGSG